MRAQERQPLLAWVPGFQGLTGRGPGRSKVGQAAEGENFVPGMKSTGNGSCEDGEEHVKVKRLGVAREGTRESGSPALQGAAQFSFLQQTFVWYPF